MTPFAAKLVCSKPCFYHDTFFAAGTRVAQTKGKSVMLSVLSVLIRWSALRFLATGDFGTSRLAHCALTRLCQQQTVCKPRCQSAPAHAEMDQFAPLQLLLQLFHLSSNWT